MHEKFPPKTINLRLAIIAAISVLLVILTISIPPISQSIEYHDFAGDEPLLGIANFLNVISNLPFLVVGILGILFLKKAKNKNFFNPKEKIFYYCFFGSVSLVCFGSSYYHLDPHNGTLVWDRAPIVMAVASIFSAILYERINKKLGFNLLYPLMLFAAFSAFYWYYTETIGQGDLRLYAFVQIYPLIIVPFIIFLLPGIYDSGKYIIYGLICYGIARVFEIFDVRIHELTADIIAGHPIKHLFAALGTYYVLVYLKKRKISNL